jgi:hypothetical protein
MLLSFITILISCSYNYLILGYESDVLSDGEVEVVRKVFSTLF